MEIAIKKCTICQIELNDITHKVKGATNWCDSCRRMRVNQYNAQNREKIRERNRKWRENNPEKWQALRKKHYDKNRVKYYQDPLNRLMYIVRNQVQRAVKISGTPKKLKTLKYIGCTVERLKEHLQEQFKPGMTWENYGTWEIDHKIPLASAKTEEDIQKLCHFSNLQPLWAEENRAKKAKMPETA